VIEKYPNEVKVVFKNFPLSSHKFSQPSAEAALAARKQGKFWEFHDELFKIYNKLSDEKIRQIAVNLGLDMGKFDKDVKDPKIAELIKRDTRDGVKAGVRGVPSIFVNGRRLQKRSLEGFSVIIDAELKKIKGSK
jgi:protein-disulfide isomerase